MVHEFSNNAYQFRTNNGVINSPEIHVVFGDTFRGRSILNLSCIRTFKVKRSHNII